MAAPPFLHTSRGNLNLKCKPGQPEQGNMGGRDTAEKGTFPRGGGVHSLLRLPREKRSEHTLYRWCRREVSVRVPFVGICRPTCLVQRSRHLQLWTTRECRDTCLVSRTNTRARYYSGPISFDVYRALHSLAQASKFFSFNSLSLMEMRSRDTTRKYTDELRGERKA